MSLESIREEYGKGKPCNERGCKLKTDGLHCVVINAETHRANERESMCDCIVFVDGRKVVVGVCELKSGDVDVRQVEKQLRAGVKLAEKICVAHVKEAKPRIIPILLTNSISTIATMKLSVTKVQVCGRDRSIVRQPCGTRMLDIMNLPM